SEIRNPKSETNPKSEIQMSQTGSEPVSDIHASNLEFVSDFGFRISDLEDETKPATGKPRIMILGGGPNRIGQGIEFDYCCVQAAFALRDAGYETIMVNSNPETVSTDYDTSDHLFFEPLTTEDVLNIYERMRP